MERLKKGDIVYYTRIMPSQNYYDILELKIATVYNNYYVGVEKREKTRRIFYDSEINNTIFLNRKDALDKINKVLDKQ